MLTPGCASTHASARRAERTIGEEAQPPFAAQGQRSLLDVAIEQVVRPLVRDDRRDLQSAGDLEVGRVAQSDRQRLSFLLQLVQLLELPLPALQGLMQLQEIDVVARQAPE